MTVAADKARTGRWVATAALVACAVLWSLNGPLIKLLGNEQVPAATIACYRSLLGGLVFVPFAARRVRSLRKVHPVWPIAGVLTFTLMTASFVKATTETFAANAIILQYTSPIWVFLLSPLLLRERPSRREGWVLLLAMLGIGIILTGNMRTDLPGLLIGLLSGLGYGSLTVVLRGLRPVNPTVVAATNAFGSGILLAVPVAFTATFALTPHQWLLMLLLALVQFALPYVLFSWALQRIEAHRAALIVLLEAVVNPLLTFLIVGEAPPVATLVGGPVILISVAVWLVLVWRRERARHDPGWAAPPA